MYIRRYISKDHDEVMFLHEITMKHVGAYKGIGSWDNDLEDINRNYIFNNGEFLVGLLNDKIIAMGALKHIDNTTAEVKRMRVHPNHQGKGLGKQILHELVCIAKNMNYVSLILETSTVQVNAHYLYKSFGFNEYNKELIDGYYCTWYKLLLQ